MGGDTGLGHASCAIGGTTEAVLHPEAFGHIDDTAIARALEYALLSALLAHPPDEALLNRLARLESEGTALGRAHMALAEAAAMTDAAAVAREYFDLFIGVGRGELLPYGSYYLTGFLHERPLARLRADLVRLGIERVDGPGEPEDHAATLCEIMAGLIVGEFAAPTQRQHQFFEQHLAPWMTRFFADLEAAPRAKFYCPVGAIGRLFIDIETAAFALPG